MEVHLRKQSVDLRRRQGEHCTDGTDLCPHQAQRAIRMPERTSYQLHPSGLPEEYVVFDPLRILTAEFFDFSKGVRG